MKNMLFLFISFFIGNTISYSQTLEKNTDSIEVRMKNNKKFPGYFNFWWNEKTGKIWLEIKDLEKEFLYVNSLQSGVGSNDIGLDRGQLGQERVVKFIRIGPKVLLIQPNYNFRAESNNLKEQKSVEEAFAQSVLWGFKIEAESNSRLLVDASKFLLHDAHNVVDRLKETKQGSYKPDPTRSALYPENILNFPENSEFEALLTFIGNPAGEYLKDVVPSPKAVTVRQHHSFVKLPDNNYQKRIFDPRSGYNAISYHDYATPIDQPLIKRFITRHRLKKKNPTARVSEAVEPIIYYVDAGAPEPIRSALVEGASWWNEAFEAAGYKDAFQVKILPDDAHPLDVRYNVIQWVHRSTRGWSYGSSVKDPRTGEIIKGHVSLGSLRVRQDFLIAQGLLSPYESGQPVSNQMLEMALARLRQLSAHEVGHTLGLMHNFAASTNDRSSVMDYPYPLIQIDAADNLNFSKAYDDKIGEWDKRTIIFGYQDFPKGTDENKALTDIVNTSITRGFRYITDQDARPQGGAHPYAHLWDNGKSAIEEMNRLLLVRQKALANFSEKAIPENAPMSTLEEVLVPLYLSHRYQTEAVAKLIGGVNYNYAVRGDGQHIIKPVSPEIQKEAFNMLLTTLNPKHLALSEKILDLIPPKPPEYDRGRESFKTRTGLTFDPIAAAESAANTTILFILHPQRAARLVEQKARQNNMLGLNMVIDELIKKTWKRASTTPFHDELNRMISQLVLQHLIRLAVSDRTSSQARAITSLKIGELENWLATQQTNVTDAQKAHCFYGHEIIQRFRNAPVDFKMNTSVEMPDGSPIGMEWQCSSPH